jgi:hypothetical protein
MVEHFTINPKTLGSDPTYSNERYNDLKMYRSELMP